MESTAVHFLPVTRFASVDEREKGLVLADARSHAARTAHARTKNRKERAKHQHTGTPSNEFPQPYHKRAPGWQHRSMSIPSYIVTGGLDPFLIVADNLSVADSKQLHCCRYYRFRDGLTNNLDLLKYTQKSDTTASGLIFCPVRALLLSKLAVSAVMVQCLMLISDLAVRADCQRVCLRRMVILNRLRELSGNEKIFKQESTAVTLATAIVAEYRAGNINAAKCHGTALQNWFVGHGGFEIIEDLKMLTRMGFLIIFTYFDITIFTKKTDFDRALARFQLPFGQEVGWLSRYVFAAGEGTQVAVLYILNLLLQHSHRDFLTALKHKILSNAELGPGALILMIAESVSQSEINVNTPTFYVLKSIEFVQLLSFATRSMRTAVVRSLAGVLLGREAELISMDKLKEEIREGWANSTYRRNNEHTISGVAVGSPFRRDESTTKLPWILNMSIDIEGCQFARAARTTQLRCPIWVK